MRAIPDTDGEDPLVDRLPPKFISSAICSTVSARVSFLCARERLRNERYNLLAPDPPGSEKPLSFRYSRILALLGTSGE